MDGWISLLFLRLRSRWLVQSYPFVFKQLLIIGWLSQRDIETSFAQDSRESQENNSMFVFACLIYC